MTSVHLAIDSGGTRSSIVLTTDGDPSQTRRFTSGATLSGYLPPGRVPATLREIVRDAEAHYRDRGLLGCPVTVFVGAAGFTAATGEHYRAALDGLLRNGFDGNVAIAGAANDAVTLLLGHEADGVVIAGTGSSVLLRASAHEIVQVGGHDWAAADQGSGFWIGLDGIRQVARDVDDGADGVLVDRFRQHYRVSTHSEVIAQFRALSVADNSMKARIAGFAEAVCDAAEQGEPTAAAIVADQAEALAGLAARAVQQHFSAPATTSPLTLVQCGGVLANAYYRVAFETWMARRLRDGDVDAPGVDWLRVDDGAAAALAVAQRLADPSEHLLALPERFRPVVLCRAQA